MNAHFRERGCGSQTDRRDRVGRRDARLHHAGSVRLRRQRWRPPRSDGRGRRLLAAVGTALAVLRQQRSLHRDDGRSGCACRAGEAFILVGRIRRDGCNAAPGSADAGTGFPCRSAGRRGRHRYGRRGGGPDPPVLRRRDRAADGGGRSRSSRTSAPEPGRRRSARPLGAPACPKRRGRPVHEHRRPGRRWGRREAASRRRAGRAKGGLSFRTFTRTTRYGSSASGGASPTGAGRAVRRTRCRSSSTSRGRAGRCDTIRRSAPCSSAAARRGAAGLPTAGPRGSGPPEITRAGCGTTPAAKPRCGSDRPARRAAASRSMSRTTNSPNSPAGEVSRAVRPRAVPGNRVSEASRSTGSFSGTPGRPPCSLCLATRSGMCWAHGRVVNGRSATLRIPTPREAPGRGPTWSPSTAVRRRSRTMPIPTPGSMASAVRGPRSSTSPTAAYAPRSWPTADKGTRGRPFCPTPSISRSSRIWG